jgi:hypothetical protein
MKLPLVRDGAEGKSYNTLLEEYVGSVGPISSCPDNIMSGILGWPSP